MSNIQIGDRIRTLREMNNYTREELAEKVDISTKFLYEIELGKKGFSAHTLSRLAKNLSVSCDYIMYGEDNRPQGTEKLAYVLETLEPQQRRKTQELLEILCELCREV